MSKASRVEMMQGNQHKVGKSAVLLHSRVARFLRTRFLRSLRRGSLPMSIKSAGPPDPPSRLVPVKSTMADAPATW